MFLYFKNILLKSVFISNTTVYVMYICANDSIKKNEIDIPHTTYYKAVEQVVCMEHL